MSFRLEYADVARCGPQHIWRVFQEVEQWSRWDPVAIRSTRWLNGTPWTKGARLEISISKPMQYTIAPEILDVDPPIYLHWRGNGGGVTGHQHFIFRPLSPDTTEMRTLQEYSGAPVLLFGKKARQPILDGIAHMFRMIRVEAEALAASEADPPASVL